MIIYENKSVTVFQSRLFQLNSTVMVTDDFILVVDPGYLPDEIEEIHAFVDNIEGDRPVYLFFTHSDFDHIAGYGAFPEAKTIASKEFVENPLRTAQLKDLNFYDEEFYIIRPYVLNYPVIDNVILANGQQLKIGETTMTFTQAFGHTSDGLMVEIDNCFVVGDYLSDIEFPFVYHSFSEYEKTLERFKTIFEKKSTAIMITSHGSVTEGKENIWLRIKDSEEYFALMKTNPSEENFYQFLEIKNYYFKHAFWKRHQDNLNVWNKE